jgi:hypothetical protein
VNSKKNLHHFDKIIYICHNPKQLAAADLRGRCRPLISFFVEGFQQQKNTAAESAGVGYRGEEGKTSGASGWVRPSH